ncbi:MAG: hypothetical protein AAGG68_12085 [Bacteroidota bacterium]
MRFYEEIVNFIRVNTIYQGHTLIKNTRKANYSDNLYQSLLNQEVTTEEEAAQLFFGVWDHRYRELRQRFISSLTTSVLMLDWSGDRSMSKYQKGYYALIREIAVAKILQGKNLRDSAVYYARRCYKKSKELACYDIMEDAVLILMRYYGAVKKRQKEFEFYLNELKQVSEYRRIEKLADEYYSSMYVHQSKSKYDSEESILLYQSYYDELSPYLDSCDSFRYQLITRLIQANVDSISCDFETLYRHCCEAVDYYLDRKVLHKTSLYIFLNQKTSACIKLGYYEEGLYTVNQSLKLLDDNSINWYPIKHNEFFIYMQSKDYKQANEVYKQVFNKKQYKNIPSYMKESWAVAEAYLHYIIELRALEVEKPAKFRVGRFLNSVPEFSKDKRVQNVPILIIQILFMILRKRTDEAIDRIERIEKYCSRHLRYNEAVRSNAFIKMLLEIPKNGFRKAAVVRKVERYQKKLAEVPLHQSGKNFDLELIPYERLWEYVLSSLK